MNALAPKAKAPATPPPSAASIRRHLALLYGDGVRAYRRGLAACKRRMSRHAVHQLRVAIRQLLACLELLEAVECGRPAVRGLLLRQLKNLGDLRDTQVQLRLVRSEPRHVPSLQKLVGHLRKRRNRRVEAVRRALGEGKALRRLERWHVGPLGEGPRLVPRLRRLLDRKLREAFDPLSTFSSLAVSDVTVRHRMRVVSREYRYVVEALRPGWRGGETEKLLASLRAYLDLIGQIHDRELLLRRIDLLIADKKLDGGSVRPYRAFLKAEKRERLKACSHLDRRVFYEAVLVRRHRGRDLLSD